MRVSVAMCTYNGEKYVRRQIESILNQTVPVDEIIVCDDLSSDDTIREIEGIGSDVIRQHANGKNLGFRKNFHQAARLCTGDIIFFADQDDEWVENKVESMLAHFERTGCDGLFSDGDLIDGDSNPITSSLFYSSVLDKYIERGFTDEELFTMLVLCHNTVTGAAFAIRREALMDFSHTFLVHDYHMAIVLAAENRLSFINEKLIRYRIHGNQKVGLKPERIKKYLDDHRLYYREDPDHKLFRHFIKRKRFYHKLLWAGILDGTTPGEQRYMDAVANLDSSFRAIWKSGGIKTYDYLYCRFYSIVYKHIWIPLTFHK